MCQQHASDFRDGSAGQVNVCHTEVADPTLTCQWGTETGQRQRDEAGCWSTGISGEEVDGLTAAV